MRIVAIVVPSLGILAGVPALGLTSSPSALLDRQAAPAPAGNTTTTTTTTGGGGLPALVSAITGLNDTLSKAQASLAPYKGGTLQGITGLLTIASSVGGLGDQIKGLTATVQATPQLTVDQSLALGQSFLTVQPKIGGLLTLLVQKRPELDKAAFRVLDVRSLVHDVMSGQSANAGALTNSIVKILDPSIQAVAQPLVGSVTDNFTTTLKAFDGRAGVIKIPTALVPQLTQLLGGLTGALGGAGGGGGGAGGGGKKVVAAGKEEQEDGGAGQGVEGGVGVVMAAANPIAEAAAQSVMNSITDERLAKLGKDENDVSGLPLPVVAALKTFKIV